MRKLIFRFLLSLLFLCLLLTQNAVSGVTGKISGKVTDKETGEPLPGVNVFIAGTSLGASSDLEGFYSILNVTPDIYDVSAMMVGYAEMTIKGARVIIDQTTRLNFELQAEFLEGETVIVIAEREAVKADVATSVASFNDEEINTIPISNVEDVLALNAGVENGLVIRGGGAEQALFQVDGVTMRDPRNNAPITNIALSGLQEVSIERGGFNAEYGQVRSGIVNIVSKEGANDSYYINVISRYSPPTKKYYGKSPYDKNSTMLRPYLDSDVAWTGTSNGVWDKYTQRQYVEFAGWNEISKQTMENTEPADDLSPAEAQELFKWQHRRQELNDDFDYNIDASIGGPVPVIGKKLGNLRFFTSFRTEREMLIVPLSRPDYKDYYWSLKLNSDISPAMKLTVTGMLGNSYNIAQNEAGLDNSTDYIRSPSEVALQVTNVNFPRATDSRLFCESYYSAGQVKFQSISAKLTHTLNPTTYYDLVVDHIYRRYETAPIGLRDMTENIEFAPGKFTNEAPYGFSPDHDPGVNGMLTGGHTSTARDNSKIQATTLRFDLSSQINNSNLVKTGAEIVYGNLNLDYGEVKERYVESNTSVKTRKYPLRVSIYLQDKLELEGLVVNGGLRMDYSNGNTVWPAVEAWDKDFYSSNYVEGSGYETKNAKPQTTISPRLSISHPITENAKLFFNYGHFSQLPTYEQLYRLSRGGSNEIRGIGDPNLSLERTISYELGYDHALYDSYLIQLAAFYRDITNQRDYTQYRSADGSINYLQATNNLYEDIRGFEFTFRKLHGRYWNAFLNFTYPVNTLGHFGRGEVYQDPKEQRDYDRNTQNMYQERPIPQPYAKANINLYSPLDYGPEWMGVHPLGSWSFNILANWRDGGYNTWNPTRQLNISQNVKGVDYFNMQFRLMKSFQFKNLSLSLYVDVYNALNARRLSLNSFYDSFDYNYYFESLHLPSSSDYDNIVGKDKVGDYRKRGTAYQPIEKVGNIYTLNPDNIIDRVIYYDSSTESYMNYVNGNWEQVDKKHMNKILDDKAYIDMPNHTYFSFLNPRQIFFGINLTYTLN